MLPIINVFGHNVAIYSLMILIGLIFGILFAVFYFTKFYNIKKEDVFYCSLFAMIGAMVGGKALYIITNIPNVIKYHLTIKQFFDAFTGGFVFYGGLIGGFLGTLIYSKVFKISLKELLLIIIPAIPLVHAFGRIGCFCAGCCYGMEYHGIGHVVFTNTDYAPLNVPLFPTQLVESFLNFLIFLVILITYKKFINTYKSIGIYCILYSIVRFILEFFRGDKIRGFIFGISTSQLISIFLFLAGILIFVHEHKVKEKTV